MSSSLFTLWLIPILSLLVTVVGVWYGYLSFKISYRQSRQAAIHQTKFDFSQETFANLINLANDGYAEAQYQLGKMYLGGRYFDGQFIQKNRPKAIELIMSAAIQGHHEAQDYVAEYGTATIRDEIKLNRSRQKSSIYKRGVERLYLFSGFGLLIGWYLELSVILYSKGLASFERVEVLFGKAFFFVIGGIVVGAISATSMWLLDVVRSRSNQPLKRTASR